LGLDGQAKMSKSLGNTISLSEPDAAIWEKLRGAATDPQRARRTDPGNPLVCNIYTLHRFFSDDARQEAVRTGCTTAGIGCIDCKKWLLEGVSSDLGVIRERAAALRADPARVDAILAAGAARARQVARAAMERVRQRMGIAGPSSPPRSASDASDR
jgi:tryptophanyl-tRNA synthetase